jgi:DNA polymerase I
VGRRARENFLKKTPGLEALKDRLNQQVETHGWVRGLDTRKVPIRSGHSALNFMIQSAGAIICKRWVCDAFAHLCSKFKHGWDGDFVVVLWVHDEIQVACRKDIAEEVGEALVRFAKTAGDPYGFRIPLDSKYSVGRTWADTH